LHNDCENRLIIPVVEDLHFFVFVVDLSQVCPDFFINAHYYDSLQRSTRAGAQLPSDSSEIVAEVNEFLCNFVLHKPEHKHLERAHHEVFDKLQYQECPQRINGIDCGLFCVGVVLHIRYGETIDKDTFSQEHVTELRLKLGDHFMDAWHNRTNETNHQPASKVV
jgi:Ulp1 family protease